MDKSFLETESNFMRVLTKVCDVMILNFYTFICCLPIVTIGASLTAMNYCCLKMIRNQELSITKQFFHSFKQNLKQATGIWLIMVLVLGILGFNYFLVVGRDSGVAWVLSIAIIVAIMGVSLVFYMVFPILARFNDTTPHIFRNAFFLAYMQFPKTVAVVIVSILPFLGCHYAFQFFPIFICACFSLPGLLNAYFYNPRFKKMEEKHYEKYGREEAPDEDEHIFVDHDVEEGEETTTTKNES